MSESNTIKFLFTRHGLSCNNVKLGLGDSLGVGKDFEPSLTDFALKQLQKNIKPLQEINEIPDESQKKDLLELNRYLRHSDPLGLPNFTFDTFIQSGDEVFVFVSPLIRTWETAVLLYGIANPSKNLHLYIGPYLKEKVDDTGLTRGNFYQSPEEIVPKFKRFLKYLVKIKHESIQLGNKTFYEIHLYWPQFKKFDLQNPNFLNFKFVISQGGVDSSIACTSSNPFMLTQKGNYYTGTFSGYDREGKFSGTGDLSKFMEKFENRDNYSDNGYPLKLIVDDKVHVVTHSQVMQAYIRRKYGIDMDKTLSDQLMLIRNSNNWSFTDTMNGLKKEIFNLDKNDEKILEICNDLKDKKESSKTPAVQSILAEPVVAEKIPTTNEEGEEERVLQSKEREEEPIPTSAKLVGNSPVLESITNVDVQTVNTNKCAIKLHDLSLTSENIELHKEKIKILIEGLEMKLGVPSNHVPGLVDFVKNVFPRLLGQPLQFCGSREYLKEKMSCTLGKSAPKITSLPSRLYQSVEGIFGKSQGGKRSKRRMGKKGKTRKIKKGKKTRKLRRRK